MITATITRRVPITQLRPGAVIDGHTIDSIELAADGATALAWPPGRSSGRRVRVPLGKLDGEVTVSATGDEAAEVAAEFERLILESDAALVADENALLALDLRSGWTFALHTDDNHQDAPNTPDDDTTEDA